MFKDNLLMISCSGLFCSVYLIHGNEAGSPGRRFDGFDVLLIQVITPAVSHALSLKALG